MTRSVIPRERRAIDVSSGPLLRLVCADRGFDSRLGSNLPTHSFAVLLTALEPEQINLVVGLSTEHARTRDVLCAFLA